MHVRIVHSSKAKSPMLVTLLGIVMLSRLHSLNAQFPMLVTPSAISTDFRFECLLHGD